MMNWQNDKFDWDKDYSLEELLQSIVEIKEFPNKLVRTIQGFTDAHFNAQYRTDSWTVKQIIHHLADAHINAFMRTKHIIHQDVNEIQVWDHNEWANGMDYQFSHESSFMMLLGTHQRWSLLLLESLKQPEVYLAKSLYHPGQQKHISIAQLIALYAWHGNHHLMQIAFAASLVDSRN